MHNAIPHRLGWVLVCALAAAASAHDGLHEQIDRASARIQESPDSAACYVRRAALYRLHEDWESALADLDRAAQLDPDNRDVPPLRARVLLSAGRAAEALGVVDQALAVRPGDGPSHLTRARALAALGAWADSAGAYQDAVQRLASAGPDIYVEWARSVAARGPAALPEAIAVLDRGIERLGGAVALQRLAIDFERQADRIDAALRRVARIRATARRQDPWLALQGDILVEAHRFDEARGAYRAALQAIGDLPARLRTVPATRRREQAVRAALEALRAGPAPARRGSGGAS